MFAKLKISTKILLVTVVITLTVIIINFAVSNSSSRNALEQEAYAKLTAVREMKSRQIEDYFQQIRNQVITFSEDRMITDSVQLFTNSFDSYENELATDSNALADSDTVLAYYYHEEFLPRLGENQDGDDSPQGLLPDADAILDGLLTIPSIGGNPPVPLQDNFSDIQDYWPADSAARLLQTAYIANNPNETGEKHLLDATSDGTSYSAVHRQTHPIIRSYLEKFGYYPTKHTPAFF